MWEVLRTVLAIYSKCSCCFLKHISSTIFHSHYILPMWSNTNAWSNLSLSSYVLCFHNPFTSAAWGATSWIIVNATKELSQSLSYLSRENFTLIGRSDCRYFHDSLFFCVTIQGKLRYRDLWTLDVGKISKCYQKQPLAIWQILEKILLSSQIIYENKWYVFLTCLQYTPPPWIIPCSHWEPPSFTSCPAFLLLLCSLDQLNSLLRKEYFLAYASPAMSHKSKNYEFVCQAAPKNRAPPLKWVGGEAGPPSHGTQLQRAGLMKNPGAHRSSPIIWETVVTG